MPAKRKRKTVQREVEKKYQMYETTRHPKGGSTGQPTLAAIAKAMRNPAVKMRKAPKNWINAKAVRVVKRNGKTIVEVKR